MIAEKIEELKSDTNALLSFFENQNDAVILATLAKFGRLENGSAYKPLLTLMHSKNQKIRALAVKNLAKLNDTSLLDNFKSFALNDVSTMVKKEAVSAIGRLRSEQGIPILLQLLLDRDPKIVMQAIRGLLVFRKNELVREHLKKTSNHPNEIIKELLAREFSECHPQRHPQPQPQHGSNSNQENSNFKNSPAFLRNLIINGDAKEILKVIPEQSVQLTFTSPPYYNARDYSIYQSYEEYLSFLENIFRQVHRVTMEGRFFILNTSPILIPRVSRGHSSKRYAIPYDIHHRLIKMGWEFIDDIIWVKPEVTVKNRNAGFLQHRKPLAYKPNPVTENVMVYRKKSDKLIDWNIRQYSAAEIAKSKVTEDYETTNVWYINPTFDKVHSAVFPIELCNRVIKYYSIVGDLIFDPFAGSGTVGKSAQQLSRNFLLTEAKEEYVARMRDSLELENNLFEDSTNKVRFLDLTTFTEWVDLQKKGKGKGATHDQK